MGPDEVLAAKASGRPVRRFRGLARRPFGQLPGVGVSARRPRRSCSSTSPTSKASTETSTPSHRSSARARRREEDVFRNRRVATLVCDLDLPAVWTDLVRGRGTRKRCATRSGRWSSRCCSSACSRFRPGREGWADAPPETRAGRCSGRRRRGDARPRPRRARSGARPRVGRRRVERTPPRLVVLGGDEAEGSRSPAPGARGAPQALADPDLPLVTHGAKAVARALRRAGAPITGLDFDTEIAAYLLDPGCGRTRLGSLATLPAARARLARRRPFGPGHVDFGDGPDPTRRPSGRHDRRPRRALGASSRRRACNACTSDVELRSSPCSLPWGGRGPLDLPYLAEMSHEFGDRLRTLEHQINDFAGIELT